MECVPWLLSFVCDPFSHAHPFSAPYNGAYLNITSLVRARTRAETLEKLMKECGARWCPGRSPPSPPASRPIIYLTFSARDIIMDALTALTV